MIGGAIKCDQCGKVDVLEEHLNKGDGIYKQMWFRVTAPQQASISKALKHDDICSLNCLQEYSNGWTSN